MVNKNNVFMEELMVVTYCTVRALTLGWLHYCKTIT